MNNQTITTEEFIRHYWDVAVYEQALTKLKQDPKSFVIKVDLDQYSKLTIPIEIVESEIRNYLVNKMYESQSIINKFSEESPEIYNKIVNR